jgi:hypothetical protein
MDNNEFYLTIYYSNIEESAREAAVSYNTLSEKDIPSSRIIRVLKFNLDMVTIMYGGVPIPNMSPKIESHMWYPWEIVDLEGEGGCICFHKTGQTSGRYFIPSDMTRMVVDFIAEHKLLVE